MKVNPKSCIKTSGVHLLLYSILQKLRQRRNNFPAFSISSYILSPSQGIRYILMLLS